MKSYHGVLAIVTCGLSLSSAFAPLKPATVSRPNLSQLYINLGEPEREKLTRDSEPQDYFKT
jgi:hypothetical protein